MRDILKGFSAGLRTPFIVKGDAAARYVSAKNQNAAALIHRGEPRRLRGRRLRNINSKNRDSALQSGGRDKTGKRELAALQPHTARLSALRAEIGPAREGGASDLDVAARAVSLRDNGTQRGRIDDPACVRARLRIWPGNGLAQSFLKKALLETP